MTSAPILALCLLAVMVTTPPAAAYSEPGRQTLGRTPPPPKGIVLPDCRPQITTLLEGQIAMKEQLNAMQMSLAAIEMALVGCPDGWVKGDGSCFKLVSEPLSADEAFADCNLRNPHGRLASLSSEAHRELVHELINDSPHKQAWVGLRLFPDGWQWSDGVTLESDDDSLPWLPHQPDNNGGEECVMYDRTERYPRWTQGWSDERCVLTAPYVCEISFRH